MGYEISTMRTALEMLDGKVPNTIPSGPRPPNAVETITELDVYGGTINHFGIALGVRLLWCFLSPRTDRVSRTILVHVNAIEAFLRYQLEEAFMCWRMACEQLSVTHMKQHFQYISLFMYVGKKYNIQSISTLSEYWVDSILNLLSNFLIDLPERKSAIVNPGARAKKIEGEYVGTFDDIAEKWYGIYRLRKEIPVISNPGQNIDQASLYFLSLMYGRNAPFIGHGSIPPLRWEISIEKNGKDFISTLVGNDIDMDAQYQAGVVNGKEVYSFLGQKKLSLPGSTLSVIFGSPVKVETKEYKPLPEVAIRSKSKQEVASEARQLAMLFQSPRREALLKLAIDIENSH